MRHLLALSLLLAPAQALAGQHALIVGNNISIDEGVAPLRFADDDAACWAELLSPLAQVQLLSVFDLETQSVHPDLVPRSVPPTMAALDEAVARVSRAIAGERARGEETTLFFVYVGHGNVGPNREGYVSLLDRKLTRTDLFDRVVARVGADYIHVIIDACNAYLMVNRRGPDEHGPAYDNLVRGWLEERDLDRYPQVGVVTSTTGERESHEWAGFRAGVFSHEVRSALLGGADVNRDGRVEYSELRAFVAAANMAVEDPRARPEIWARPPARDRARPLVDLRHPGYERFLVFPSFFSGRFHVEDSRGVRLADLNKAADRTVALALPKRPFFFLRTGTSEARVEMPERGMVDASMLAWRSLELASRGAVEAALARSLFQVPYGPSFYRGFAATAGDLPVAEPPDPWAP